jgi:hypothetical protein
MSRQRLWDARFLELAKLVATWSKDPSTQVGAVIVDPHQRVISLGLHGFPQRIADDARLPPDRARASPRPRRRDPPHAHPSPPASAVAPAPRPRAGRA